MNNPADDETNPEMIPAIPDPGLNDREMRRQVIALKLFDAQIPGFQAEFDPDEAELLGAFKEDALNLNPSVNRNQKPTQREIT